jgi:LPXTG-motif cell wall-anchored protein
MNRKLFGTCVLAVAATGLLAPAAASAATASGVPSEGDVTEATKVVAGSSEWLGKFFVNADTRTDKSEVRVLSDVSAEQAVAKAPKISAQGHAVYALSADFVRSSTPIDKVADFAHVAVPATSASGQQASVAVVKDDSGAWVVENVTTGTEDITFSTSVKGIVFTEPQINAWYELRGDQVVALNDTARTSVGESTTVATYHQMVHARYADKLPGSDYQNKNMYGGVSPESFSVASAAPATSGDNTTGWLVGGLALIALAGGAVAYRRTRVTH